MYVCVTAFTYETAFKNYAKTMSNVLKYITKIAFCLCYYSLNLIRFNIINRKN